eukprot:TRINITY_DN3811_c0_g1_i2.p1 TRINITY_DN3811_c0_g1~~TRINITY_DN3811_c0_g1_i2.p1  ORF type:complete len:108 (+),score=18.15 TRINITY_DN3811_c0_g1_i2:46-324(+)
MKSIMGAVIDNELTDARAEPRRALMFMCAQHERCGAHSHAASLGPDVARWIIELAKPISIQKACTAGASRTVVRRLTHASSSTKCSWGAATT